MTPEQQQCRDERVAIMIHDGKCTEEAAQKHCDKYPIVYGVREPTQQVLHGT